MAPPTMDSSTSATSAQFLELSTCSQKTKMSSATCFGQWRTIIPGPIAIRYPRGIGTGAEPKRRPVILEIGKAEVLCHGSRVAIIALGTMVEIALEAATKLEEQGISTAVINARWIKPLDVTTIEFFARGCEDGLHDGGPRPSQWIWMCSDGTPRGAKDYHAGRPGGLA